MKTLTLLRQGWHELLDLVLPLECGGCGRAGAGWCSSCAVDLRAVTFPGPRHTPPSPAPPGMPLVIASGRYAGPLRAAIVAAKDGGRADLRPMLATLLAPAIEVAAGVAPHAVLVPMPSSRAAVRRRGGHGRRAVAAYLAPAPPWSPGRDGTRPRAAACRPSRAGQRGTRGRSAWGVCRLVAAPGLAGGTRGGAGRRHRHDGGHARRGRSGAAGRGRSGHRSRGRGGHGTPTQVMSWPSGLIERTRLRWKNTVRDVWR